jgi:hypothetical protein
MWRTGSTLFIKKSRQMAKLSSILGFEQRTSSLAQPLRKESHLLYLEAKFTNNKTVGNRKCKGLYLA